MKNRLLRLAKVLMVSIAIGCMGCTAANRNLRTDAGDDRFRDVFQQPPVKFPDSRIARLPDKEVSAQAKLPEMTSEEHERLGDLSLYRGSFQTALVHYDKCLHLAPENLRAIYKKGLALLFGGMPESAVKEFQTVISQDPQYAMAYQGLGQAFFRMKNLDEAEQQFLEAVRLNPDLWRSHDFLGIIYDYRREHEPAIRNYQAAIALQPDNPLLHNNLGMSYYLAGDFEKAVDSFNKALELGTASQKSRTYNNLGLTLCRLGRYQEALKYFREGGDEAQAYNNLGCVYFRDGKFEKAMRSFEKALELKATFYTKANENLEKCRMAQLYESSRDSFNRPTAEQHQ